LEKEVLGHITLLSRP